MNKVSEKRLIDADDCGRYIASRMGFSQASLENVMQYMEDYIKQNEVDDDEVDDDEEVHGRWKHQYEKGMSYKVCSICGCRNGLDLKFNYCPNCGAKMDGERKDNDTTTDKAESV